MIAAGADVGGSRLVESRSPQAPGDLLVAVPAADRGDVHAAAERGRRAQRGWWDASAGQRAGALKQLSGALSDRAAEAADLVVREVGKPVVEARAEVARAISILDYYAQQSFAPVGAVMPASMPGRLWTERRPHGLAGLITPWNFPLAIPLWKSAPALAAGNGVLLKPSPESAACALWLGELVADALPDGLVQVLPGGADAGAAVVEVADVVSFTGSAAVGRQVAITATQGGTSVQAEMGGQNAAIVLPDADAAHAASLVAQASMGFAGQKCTATRRVVVVGPEARQREVRAALVAAVEAVAVGDPAAEGTAMGPVITEDARRRVAAAATMVRESGGQVLAGGDATDDDGWFLTPGLADGLGPDHILAQEELFGPFVLVQSATDVAEAVALAEGVRYGLVTSVHGRDAGQLLDVVASVGTGMVKVNAPTTGVDFYAPFGGERDSSYGQREQGAVALDFYSSSRTVTFAPHA
ncbi:MAG: aldehyde dehydrogenase family protein [Nocardioidaceae bacterium]